MHRSRLGNLVIDCNSDDLLAEARFWSEALGYPLPEMIDDDSPFIQLRTPPGEVQA
ncbi:MAG: VOC family protein, partial [Pseudomonas sp.]|nr:VOC family protein [Pseudomonas sp.]